MGNTGAALTVATLFTLRRIPGIKRPALSGIYPVSDKYITMLDLGANADSKPEWLVQFALMGQIYAQHTLGLREPRIALLSNGEEEGKGNHLIHESADLLKQTDLNYIGNVEPKDVMRLTADVIVSDGYVGNIFVKTFEASASLISDAIREEARSDILSSVGGLLMKSAFQRVRKRTSTSELGGAPLLGVNGVVIIGHGRSDAFAIKNAIRQAALAVYGQVIEKIQAAI
jgi:glycerol-3-phosphate acyltransferase PlsX